MSDFEPPHSNGALHHHDDEPIRSAHGRPPWEFLILLLFVLIIGAGIILAWTLVGSHSPERLDEPTAAPLSQACDAAQTQLKALPNPFPRAGADRVERIRSENARLRTMTAAFATVHPANSTEASALQAWTADWNDMIAARDRYADALERSKDTNAKVEFVLPASEGVKPITENMDDYVRENHPRLDACFTQALQLDVVEGTRDYKKVTK